MFNVFIVAYLLAAMSSGICVVGACVAIEYHKSFQVNYW
jgi:hypothetical protein